MSVDSVIRQFVIKQRAEAEAVLSDSKARAAEARAALNICEKAVSKAAAQIKEYDGWLSQSEGKK
mgnify:FL=1